MVTDQIDTFTERGITLASGRELEADIIVTATGLNMQPLGGIALTVDGAAVNLSERVTFRSFMLDRVPNFAFVFGYSHTSWTLKVGLVAEHFCRLLGHMDTHRHTICYPELPSPDMPTRPFLDFGAGYVQRAMEQFPRQGEGPWRMSMDYRGDVKTLRKGPVAAHQLRLGSAAGSSPAAAAVAQISA